jgi:hypothetical protein
MKNLQTIILIEIVIVVQSSNHSDSNLPKTEDQIRASQIREMKFGTFNCWFFSTFSGQEWIPTLDRDASYFKAFWQKSADEKRADLRIMHSFWSDRIFPDGSCSWQRWFKLYRNSKL